MIALARAYGVSIGALFEGNSASPEACVVRGKTAPVREGDGLRYVALSNASQFKNLQPIRLTIRADRQGYEQFEHDGEEWIYVLSGQVSLALRDTLKILEVGDAAHFDSRVPHRLSAMNGSDAEVIVVACPLEETTLPTASTRSPGKRIESVRKSRKPAQSRK